MKPFFIKGRSIFVHQYAIPDKLIELIQEEYVEDIEYRPLMRGEVAGTAKEQYVDQKERDCEIEWIPTTEWLVPLMWHHIKQINDEVFKYDVYGMDSIQLTSYSEGEYYHWHVDSYHHNHRDDDRKLTCVLQLSDEDEYTGGELQILAPGYKDMQIAPKKKGSLIVFDSRLAHRVKPIKSGKRIAAVGWVHGPLWR